MPRCGPAILSPELTVVILGGRGPFSFSLQGSSSQRSSGGWLPFAGCCCCYSGLPTSFGGSTNQPLGCTSEMKWGLRDCQTVAWACSQRLILTLFWVFPVQRETGSPQLILPHPGPNFWTFLFLVQPLTLNLRFNPGQTSQCEDNNSALGIQAQNSVLCEEPKSAFLSVGAGREILPETGGRDRIRNMPTTHISLQRNSTVMV